MALNKEIYKYLYNYTKDRLEEAGEKIEYSEELFMTCTFTEESTVDLFTIKNFENRDFLTAAYMTLLQRVPDDKVYEIWQNSLALEKDEFQKKVVLTIINSNEFKIKGMKIKNNYTEAVSTNNLAKTEAGTPNLTPALDGIRKSWLFRVYSHFPYGVRVRLRKIFGVDK